MESKSHDDLGSLVASLPVLVYEHGEQPDDYCQTMLSVADGSLHTYQIPEMSNYMCLVTQRGLVLTVDTVSLQSSLWNPQTGEKIALPAMDKQMPEQCQCLLSDTINSPDCIVLIYDLEQPELLFCQLTGGGTWISQSYDLGCYKLPESYCPQPKKIAINGMTAIHGKFYFIESTDVIGVLRFTQDPEPHLELSTFDARMPRLDSNAPQVVTMAYILESSQELFLVCLFFLGCGFERIEEVSAYKMDFSKQEWCKVTNIGDRVFFLGHNPAASCSAMEHGLKRGCVYFAYNFFEDSTDFHIFDLLEGTRELAGPNQDVPPLACDPFWMVPVLP
ncbi:hypothetical protein ACP70R_031096 [Stipagrostis hirtigluma subsp. patula]